MGQLATTTSDSRAASTLSAVMTARRSISRGRQIRAKRRWTNRKAAAGDPCDRGVGVGEVIGGGRGAVS
jgi:hypothetical protein